MQYAGGVDVIYYAYANEDFTDLEGEPKPLFIPKDKKSCIDGDIVYKDGVYHLYFQYNPYGSVWGNMHWGHSTSTDLKNWKIEGSAIVQDAWKANLRDC